MKIIKLLSFYSTIVISVFLITNGIVKINKENTNYKVILEENRHLSLIQEKECILHHDISYCDKFQNSWRCREIKALAMSLAEIDKNDPKNRLSFINNHHMLVNKYNTECLVEK
jgi:hypothetical protein